MTSIMISLLILGGLLVLVGLWFMGAYNRFVHLRALLDEAFSGIDVQLKRRSDLIPNLVETVKGYAGHEKSVFENVAKYRSALQHATTIQETAKADQGLTQALKTLFAVAENYPDLKASANFQSLQDQLALIEQDLQLARRYYNGTVRNYNILVQSFPSKIVAGITGFEKAPFFEVDAADRQAPRVQF